MEDLLNYVRELYEMPDLEVVEIEVADNDEDEDGSVTMHKIEIPGASYFIGATAEQVLNMAIAYHPQSL